MSTKPPLGLMPEWRHKELRLQEIREAVQRYLDANEAVPVNWIAEEYALRLWLENRKAAKQSLSNTPKEEQLYKWEEIEKEFFNERCTVVPKEQPSKEWEILAYRIYGGTKIIQKGSVSEMCFNGFTLSNEEIFSVRRISDGEVFSVGDEVSMKCPDGYNLKITGFEISGHCIGAKYERTMWVNISQLIKTNR